MCNMYNQSLMRCEMRWLKRSWRTQASLQAIMNSVLVSMSKQLVPLLVRKGFSVQSSLNRLTWWCCLTPQKFRFVSTNSSFAVSYTIFSTNRFLNFICCPQARSIRNVDSVQIVHLYAFPQNVFSSSTLLRGSSLISRSMPHSASPTVSTMYSDLATCQRKGRPKVSQTVMWSSVLRRSSKRMAERSSQVDFSYSCLWTMSSRWKLWFLSMSRITFHTGSTLQLLTRFLSKSLNYSSSLAVSTFGVSALDTSAAPSCFSYLSWQKRKARGVRSWLRAAAWRRERRNSMMVNRNIDADQQVIFWMPIPAKAFSTDPRATTISTVPLSSQAMMRPNASAPAMSPWVTPLQGCGDSASGQLGKTMALKQERNLSLFPKQRTSRQMCWKGCPSSRCEGSNSFARCSRGSTMNAMSCSVSCSTSPSQNFRSISERTQSTTISSTCSEPLICPTSSLHCRTCASSPIRIKLNPLLARKVTYSQLQAQSAISAQAMCPYLSNSCCREGTFGFGLRAEAAREREDLAMTAMPSTTAKLTKDLLQRERSKSRAPKLGRLGRLSQKESVVDLRLLPATVAAPIYDLRYQLS